MLWYDWLVMLGCFAISMSSFLMPSGSLWAALLATIGALAFFGYGFGVTSRRGGA